MSARHGSEGKSTALLRPVGRRVSRGLARVASALLLATLGLVLPAFNVVPAFAITGGTIAGDVTKAGGVSAGVGEVDLFDTNQNFISSMVTGADGHYEFDNVAAGGYHVQYWDFIGLANEFYNHSATSDSAATVSVTNGVTTTVNTQLGAAAILHGHVTVTGGADAGAGGVAAYDAAGNWVTSVTSDGSGNYSFDHLIAGSYYVEFYAFPGAAYQWYNHVSRFADAGLVVVGAGTTNLDYQLPFEAIIAGNVTINGGGAALGGCALAYTTAGDYVTEDCVDGSGHYSIAGLTPGNYLLRFSGFTGGVSEWYNHAANSTDADAVVTTAGSTTTINVALTHAGSISGTMTIEGGAAAHNGCAYVYDGADNFVSSGCVSGSGNTYSVIGLAPGTYHVYFSNFDSAVNEWYDNAANFGTSTPVVVTGGSNTVANGTLASGPGYGGTGSLSGTLTVPSGLPMAQTNVDLYSIGGDYIDSATPAPNGSYGFAGLNNGAYQVCFTYDLGLLGCTNPIVSGGGATTGVDGDFSAWEWVHVSGVVKSTSDQLCPSFENGTGAGGGYPYCVQASGSTSVVASYVQPPGTYYIDAYDYSSVHGSTDYLWYKTGTSTNLFRSAATAYPTTSTPLGSPTASFDFSAMAPIGNQGVSTSLLSPAGPVKAGQSITLTARVSGSSGTPTGVGELRNYDTNDFIGDGSLVSGVFSVPYTVPYPSPSSLELHYRGDATYAHNWSYFGLDYLPTISSIAPGYDAPAGGETVNIVGTALGTTTSVTFDGVAATNLAVYGDSEITVTTPPGTSPTAAVVVTNTFGPSDPYSFAYLNTSVEAGTPTRIADIHGFTANTVRCYPVVGLADVPAGAVGVMLNVTVAQPAGNGYVVIYPDYAGDGTSAAPTSSSVNFEAGQDVANSAMVQLPSDGDVCAYTQGATVGRLILDVAGYIVPGSGITLQNSVRLADTRPGGTHVGPITGPIAPSAPYVVQVTGNAGVPSGATAVVANVTVTGITSPGHLRMWADGDTLPNTSVVNYAPGQTKANGQIIGLSSGGALDFESFTGAGTSTNPVQVIIDVVGYVSAGSLFQATDPTRIVETRASAGIVGPIPGPLVPNTVYPVTLSDTSLIPSDATAVVLNVTAVSPTAFGNLRVYPDTNGLGTTAPPLASNLNYIPGRAIPNMVIVQIPADRKIDFYNNQGLSSSRTDLIVDVIGYIAAAP